MSVTYISAELRRQVIARAENLCEYCLLHDDDTFFGGEVDHIISEKHAGPTEEGNLAYACLACNRSKGSDIASLVPRNDAPRQVPPAGVALQITAIRKAFSLALKQHFISEVQTRDAAGKVYELYRGDVVNLIQQGQNTFFVKGADGSQASVEVRNEHNSTFIATHPDATTADNLLSLPAF